MNNEFKVAVVTFIRLVKMLSESHVIDRLEELLSEHKKLNLFEFLNKQLELNAPLELVNAYNAMFWDMILNPQASQLFEITKLMYSMAFGESPYMNYPFNKNLSSTNSYGIKLTTAFIVVNTWKENPEEYDINYLNTVHKKGLRILDNFYIDLAKAVETLTAVDGETRATPGEFLVDISKKVQFRE